MPPVEDSIGTNVDNLIKQNKVIVFSKTTCPYCDKTKELFKSLKIDYLSIELDRIGKLKFLFIIFFLFHFIFNNFRQWK
jgi:protein-disulfide isomerase